MRDSNGRFLKGGIAPNKGKKITHSGSFKKGHRHSEESRKKMSDSHKGKKLSEEHKQKLKGRKAWNLGMKMSDEFRKKISDSHLGIRKSIKTEIKK